MLNQERRWHWLNRGAQASRFFLCDFIFYWKYFGVDFSLAELSLECFSGILIGEVFFFSGFSLNFKNPDLGRSYFFGIQVNFSGFCLEFTSLFSGSSSGKMEIF